MHNTCRMIGWKKYPGSAVQQGSHDIICRCHAIILHGIYDTSEWATEAGYRNTSWHWEIFWSFCPQTHPATHPHIYISTRRKPRNYASWISESLIEFYLQQDIIDRALAFDFRHKVHDTLELWQPRLARRDSLSLDLVLRSHRLSLQNWERLVLFQGWSFGMIVNHGWLLNMRMFVMFWLI